MAMYLFSYGTLQKETVQLNLFGRKLKGAKDRLPGYKLTAIEIKDPAFISQGEQSRQRIALPASDEDLIEGTVFEVSMEELIHSDSYEPEDYHRIEVTLESGKRAWVYAADERREYTEKGRVEASNKDHGEKTSVKILKKIKYVFRVIWWIYGWFTIFLGTYVIIDLLVHNGRSTLTFNKLGLFAIIVFLITVLTLAFVGTRERAKREKGHHLDGDPEF